MSASIVPFLAKRSRIKSLTEEQLLEMEFAPYAETLRRLSFYYFHRPVLLHSSTTESGAVHRTFGVMTASEALIQFARDMKICPRLLMLSEVHEALVRLSKERQMQLRSAAGMDANRCRFLVICAELVAAKRPFCNLLASSPRPKQVLMASSSPPPRHLHPWYKAAASTHAPKCQLRGPPVAAMLSPIGGCSALTNQLLLKPIHAGGLARARALAAEAASGCYSRLPRARLAGTRVRRARKASAPVGGTSRCLGRFPRARTRE